MKKLEILLCVMLLVFGVVRLTKAAPRYYTYEGTLGKITTSPGGSTTYITDQGINVGDDFTWIIVIDFDRPGEKTRNNGDTYTAGDFYADLVYNFPNFIALNTEYNVDPQDTAEYNYGWVKEHEQGWRSDVYVGSGGAYSHLDNYGFLLINIYDWEVGQVCEVAFTVVDYLTGESACGYTTGTLTSISDINPVPEPAKCLFFNGADSYVEIPDTPELSGGPGKNMTVEAWFFLSNLPPDWMAIVQKYWNYNNKDWGLFLDKDGYVGFQKETWSLPGPPGNWQVYSSETVATNEWNHVAFVYDNDNDIVNVYVNGVLSGSREAIGHDLPDTDAVVSIGASGPFYQLVGDPIKLFSGYFGEVRIWGVARTEEEIFSNMLPGSITGSEEGLVAYYDFVQGEDFSILYDQSGNSNNGEIFGALWTSECPVPEHFNVALDIKPQSCPNNLNTKSRGVLPVAMLGTYDFDVTQIDPASIRLMDVAPLRSALEDIATPFEPLVGKEDELDCTDLGPDGYLDLTLKFDTQEVVDAIGDVEDGDVAVLTLTGNLKDEFGGTPIQGEDVVVILRKGKK